MNIRWVYSGGRTWSAQHDNGDFLGEVTLIPNEELGHSYVVARYRPLYQLREHIPTLEAAKERLLDLIREANP